MEGKVYIIAEAGVNHNGSVELARKMIDAAVAAGADAVKFQSFKAAQIVSKAAPKAQYQNANTSATESQYEMLEKLEMSNEMHQKLVAHCRKKGIEFLSTPFDFDSLDILVKECDIAKIKIPSGEITNAPLLLKIARTGKPVVLSTGMSTLGDIETALGVLAYGYLNANPPCSLQCFIDAYASPEGQAVLRKNVTLLHCTTEYPAAFDEVNLRSMDTLKQAFELPVGFSDHTPGISVSFAAVARGAAIIEKHFTLDKNFPGPDHKASLEPQELKAMITGIRQIELALGRGIKSPTLAERKNKLVARKSLVAARDICQGEVFSVENLAIKRPGGGIAPIFYWEILGKKAVRSFRQDEQVQ